LAQVVHLLVGKEKVGVGPAFDALRGADLDEAAAKFEDIKFLAVLYGGYGGRF
jgi:hypothetical protein